jgi:endophilin-A
MPPSGSGKDKILYTEAVGLVMIDYGDAVVGGFGK